MKRKRSDSPQVFEKLDDWEDISDIELEEPARPLHHRTSDKPSKYRSPSSSSSSSSSSSAPNNSSSD
jgi:hypothetical protein